MVDAIDIKTGLNINALRMHTVYMVKQNALNRKCEVKEVGRVEREVIFLVEEEPEGGYAAKALGHAVFTQADSINELRRNVKEAVACHFDEGERPAVICMCAR